MNTYIFIHGGESFTTESEYHDWIKTIAVEWSIEPFSLWEEKKKWKYELAKRLIEQGDIVYMPNFPNPQNAKYYEWKMFFDAWIEKIVIQGSVTFIGSSLGGNFLLKYFSETNTQGPISIIPRYEESLSGSSYEDWIDDFSKAKEKGIPTEWQKRMQVHAIHLLAACQECWDFSPPTNYEFLQKLGNNVHIWHAEDDGVVPFSIGQELAKILPEAKTHFFGSEKWYGHFHGLERIPELEESIFFENLD